VAAGTPGGHTTSETRRAKAIVAALAITQTVGYGTLYYAFAVFLTPLAADLHTTATAVTGAFTVSILVSAVLAIPVGRWLDHHGGQALMTAGSVLGALMLAAWSQVHTLGQLYAVQIGIGIASATVLYEAAFAVVIAWHTPPRRPGALLAVTIVAGFASTIFLPLSGWLTDQYGWRTALLTLAVIQGVTVPLHALVLRTAPRSATHPEGRDGQSPVRLRAVLADRGFWLLAVSFTANTAAITAVTVHLVAALTSWGHPAPFAATVAGLFGVLSVTGRLTTTGLQRRWHTIPIVATLFAVQGIAAALLPILGRSTVGAVSSIVLFGLGFGVATIAKPVLLAERYDTRRYATIAGTLVVPITIAKATAPLGAAWLHATTGGYRSAFLATALTCVIAAAALTAMPRARP
jgi:predicted MFS family arabinose efflux permease